MIITTSHLLVSELVIVVYFNKEKMYMVLCT